MEVSKPDSNVKATIDAVAGLAKAIPVYQDVVQPAAKQIGQSLETVAKTVNIVLSPIMVLVWGYDQIENFITTRVSEKLKGIPVESIVTPKPEVAGPLIEAMRYTGHSEDLRELFANLLANSMDSGTIHEAHPAFVDVVKSMTSEEARLLRLYTIEHGQIACIDVKSVDAEGIGYNFIFRNFTTLYEDLGMEQYFLIPAYLDNLCRLGILSIPEGKHLVGDDSYKGLMDDKFMAAIQNEVIANGRLIDYERKFIALTSFGKQFMRMVVWDKK